MRNNDDNLSPGDIGDPVADNLRNEMNRDAMPSKAEAEADRLRYLRMQGCKHCGEGDPDVLQQAGWLTPSCSAMQHPDDPFYVICDDCLEERPDSYREKRLQQFEEHDADVAVVYDCDRVEFVGSGRPTMEVEEQIGWDDVVDEPIMETKEVPQPHTQATAEIRPRCRCGAVAVDIIVVGD